jgi:phosphate transport system protein
MTELRKAFGTQLSEVRRELAALAASVVELIPRGTEVLLSGDLAGADALINSDDELDAKSVELEEHCLQLLALQSPMAGDLRTVVATIRMISDIERSGDLVVNICKAARRLYGVELDPRLRGLIARMSEQAHQLFRFALEAYDAQDASLAAALPDIDNTLDATHAEFIQAIFEVYANERVDLQVGVQLALIGRFYERIGDHAVNVGERVRYMVTGWMPDHGAVARAGGASTVDTTPSDSDNALPAPEQ